MSQKEVSGRWPIWKRLRDLLEMALTMTQTNMLFIYYACAVQKEVPWHFIVPSLPFRSEFLPAACGMVKG